MSGRRTIVVGDQEWKYKIGDKFVVAKNTETGKGIRGDLSEVTGFTWDTIEDMWWSRSFHITPKQIALWIALED